MNPYIPVKARIIEKWRETSDTVTLRIDYPCSNSPGQFVEAGILGIGECPISISSHSDKHIDLCIRAVGNVTRHLTSLSAGDYMHVRGPFGSGYPVKELIGRDLVFVGGGTGAAPLRSLIELVLQKRSRFMDVSMFLGFRSPEDILFKRDIALWQDKFNVSITVDKPGKSWKGSKGLVTALLDRAKLDSGAKAILCGPPVMIKFVIELLLIRGFKEENIYTSYERLMHCGIGKCGHCMVSGKYVCKDGPVFRYDTAKRLME